MTFHRPDLEQFDTLLLSRAASVISLREVHAGNHCEDCIALRHDVDDNRGSFETAQVMARWESYHGYRSTYFVLHGAHYWSGSDPFFRAGLEEIALNGHEVGIHVNCIAEALRTGKDPDEILWEAVEELRSWGHAVIGAASHGDSLCHDVGFVNYEQFEEHKQDDRDPYRRLVYRGRSVKLQPLPLSAFRLAYEAYLLPRGRYLSDSGGRWSLPLEPFALKFEFDSQLHILQHPDWWGDALSPDREEVAA